MLFSGKHTNYLDSLRYAMLKYKAWKEKQLFIMAISIIGTQIQNMNPLDHILGRTSRRARLIFIDKYGKMQTEIYLMGTKCTTKTGTLQIIRFQTSNYVNAKSIRSTTGNNCQKLKETSLEIGLMRLDILLLNGMDRKKGLLGIENMGRELGKQESRLRLCVKNVAQPLLLKPIIKSIAQTSVRQKPEENLVLIMSLKSVNFAVQSTQQINTASLGFAQISVENLVIGQRYKNKQHVKVYISREAA